MSQGTAATKGLTGTSNRQVGRIQVSPMGRRLRCVAESDSSDDAVAMLAREPEEKESKLGFSGDEGPSLPAEESKVAAIVEKE